MRPIFLIGCLVVAVVGVVLSVQAAIQEVSQPADWIASDVNGMHYEVLLPDNYAASRSYPVVLYLHQLDMGDYRESLRKQADGWFAKPGFRSKHPCIVVMPMLDQTKDPGGREVNFGGKREGHVGEDNTIAALRQVMDHYSVDTGRIYVTGNSMGGMGAWQMLLDYNVRTGTKGHIFAAGMPVAGAQRTADPAVAAMALQAVPIWAIHGANDPEVSLDWDRAMARLLSDSKTFRYTEVPGVGHDVWDVYYKRDDVWDWLFSQGGRSPRSG